MKLHIVIFQASRPPNRIWFFVLTYAYRADDHLNNPVPRVTLDNLDRPGMPVFYDCQKPLLAGKRGFVCTALRRVSSMANGQNSKF